ncbi:MULTISPECIES: PAS domain S-box protein [Roseomonadaceae]|uniref:histidine kinase n=1 Tax=Falsiroseomonas oleicola TaxID=2801474 RepID=A0ABS6HD53_9PROT|nr:PAS domain S-box protein [Roseomonas oleicola]MBU8546667.1 PAS domain S-box protein [Roseomonas oleicola]
MTEPLAAFIEAEVAGGRHASAEDVVATALRLLQSQAAPAEDNLFRQLAEDAPALLWMGDAGGHCVYLNRALRDFWGVPPGGLAGFDWFSTLHPDDAAALAEPFTTGMRLRQGFVAEARYRHAGGGWRWLRTEARPRFSTEGHFLGMIGVNVDLTEQREAEAARRDLLETLDLASVLVRDMDGTIRFWAAGCTDIYGWTAAEALGQSAHALLDSRFPIAHAAIEAQLLRGEHWQGDVAQRHRDGSLRTVSIRKALRRDAAGRPVAVTESVTDVTSLREAEQKARESEARQRALFDAAPFAVIVIDPVSHAILEVNERACTDYGYSREAFLRLHIGDVDALGSSCPIRARGRQCVAGPGAQEFEARHRLSNGTIRDVLVRVQGVRAGGRDMTYGAHIDITDRKAAEAALRASEARLRLALEAVGFGIWEYDVQRGVGRAKGMPADIVPEAGPGEQSLEEWLRPMHPEDRPLVEAGMAAILRGDIARCDVEVRLSRRDGCWRWIASRGAVVETDEEGRPRTLAGVARDITDQREAAERQTLLAREVDHRAKNALAVVQAALRLTKAPDLPSYIKAIEGRVAALARTQTLLAENRWGGADLSTLLRGEIAPFVVGQRVTLEGPEVVLGPALAQALAMAFHELATNAVKHGALSVAAGRVRVAWDWQETKPGRLRLRWMESEGPPLPAPPQRRGFGSRVLDATLSRQLGGAVRLDWQATGLVCEMEVPLPSAAPGG